MDLYKIMKTLSRRNLLSIFISSLETEEQLQEASCWNRIAAGGQAIAFPRYTQCCLLAVLGALKKRRSTILPLPTPMSSSHPLPSTRRISTTAQAQQARLGSVQTALDEVDARDLTGSAACRLLLRSWHTVDHDGRSTSRILLLQLVRRSFRSLLVAKQATDVRAIEVGASWRIVNGCLLYFLFEERDLSSKQGHLQPDMTEYLRVDYIAFAAFTEDISVKPTVAAL